MELIDFLRDLLLSHKGVLLVGFELIEALGHALAHCGLLRFEQGSLLSIRFQIRLDLLLRSRFLPVNSFFCVLDFHLQGLHRLVYFLLMR